MIDDATTLPLDATPAPSAVEVAPAVRHCPWCSELLPADATVRCPSCHANLVADGETHFPGLTEVEAPAVARARRLDAPKRSKLLAWISGEVEDEGPIVPGGPSDPDAVALPPNDVRREMLRLQLEAKGLTLTEDGAVEPAIDATEAEADAADAAATDAGPATSEATRAPAASSPSASSEPAEATHRAD